MIHRCRTHGCRGLDCILEYILTSLFLYLYTQIYFENNEFTLIPLVWIWQHRFILVFSLFIFITFFSENEKSGSLYPLYVHLLANFPSPLPINYSSFISAATTIPQSHVGVGDLLTPLGLWHPVWAPCHWPPCGCSSHPSLAQKPNTGLLPTPPSPDTDALLTPLGLQYLILGCCHSCPRPTWLYPS